MIISIVFVFAGAVFLFLAISSNIDVVLDEQEFDVFLEVGDVAGFYLGSNSLDFGRIVPGSSGTRKILLENNYNFPINVFISSSGEVEQFLNFDEVVYLDVGESKSLSFVVDIPRGSLYGEYFGKVFVKIKENV